MPSVSGDRLCPSCGDLIPAGTPGCGRCGYDTTAGSQPKPAAPPAQNPYSNPYSAQSQARIFVHNPADDRLSWQEIAFKVMAVIILIEGVLDLILGVVSISRSGGATGGISIAYGAVTLLIGIGLLAEWEFASIILKIYCWLSILAFAGAVLICLAVAMSGAVIGWLGVAIFGLFIGLYAFMLYLVNEVGQA